MGHVEQYARAYARTRVCVLVSKPSICTIRTVLGTCTRVRAYWSEYSQSAQFLGHVRAYARA